MNRLSLPVLLLLGACAHEPTLQVLMPTPVLYSEQHVDPFAHLEGDERSPQLKIFYATNRSSEGHDGRAAYGNGIGHTLHMGSAVVRFGDDSTTWQDVYEASVAPAPRAPDIAIHLEDAEEIASLPTESGWRSNVGDRHRAFADAINDELRRAESEELMVYVHGAKVDFYNAMAFTAEMAHFAGRDLVSVGFSWPTHQNILAYVLGIDTARARTTAAVFDEFIEFLAENTQAKAINIVCWSAGARVVSRGLASLRADFPGMTSEGVREHLRIKSVTFAAADVPRDDFLERLPAIHDISDRVTMFISEADNVLEWSTRVMRGGARMGMANAEILADDELALAALNRVEIVDTSYGKDDRGFDVTGHRYWYQHPWVNTDVILSVRTDKEAPQRGLEQTEYDHIWWFPPDYPRRAGDAVSDLVSSEWRRLD